LDHAAQLLPKGLVLPEKRQLLLHPVSKLIQPPVLIRGLPRQELLLFLLLPLAVAVAVAVVAILEALLVEEEVLEAVVV
jgi:hypothetical protein